MTNSSQAELETEGAAARGMIQAEGHASRPHPIRGYLYIAAATLFWAISATLGRAAFTGKVAGGEGVSEIGPLILAQSRTTLSLLILAPLVILFRGPASLHMPRADVLRAFVLGVLGIAASNYFYYLSIQQMNVAISIVLQYIAPVWVLLWMVLRGKQRATLTRAGAVGLAVLGSALAIGVIGNRGVLKVNSLGLVAALLAAIAFAFYNIYGHGLLERHNRWTVLLYALTGAAITWMFINSPAKILAANYSREQWGFLLLFAITSILLPFSFYFAGLTYLDATRAIVTSCLEPVFAILLAAWLLGETLGPLQVVGVMVVMGATILVQLPDKPAKKS